MRRRTQALAGLAATAVAVTLTPGVTAVAQASQLVEITIPARHGDIPNQWLPRYPMGGPPKAKVLLPDGYNAKRRYPLLVLLAGLNNNYHDWSDQGKGEIATTARNFPGIIVMPEGSDGWYADWWNKGKRSDPAWESYVLDEVIPQTLARYRIRPERRYHALAGVSMGGLGAAYLGGRLPGFFGSTAIISGLVDLNTYENQGAAQSAISESSAGMAPSDPEVVEGPPHGFYANGHDPVHLAANFAQARVFMATGDGSPAPYSGHGDNPVVDQAEEGTIIRPASDNLAVALRAAGVDLTFQQHAGFHEWANFRRELRDAIAWNLFAPVDEHATSWVNDTVATHGQLWEFGYRFDTPPTQVVRFRRSGGRLSVSAAGSPVTITTTGRCSYHVATPVTLTIPRKPCRRARRAAVG